MTEGLWFETEWDGGTVMSDGMGRSVCGVRRNGIEGLCFETKCDERAVVCDGMGRRNFGVSRNVTLALCCETEWNGVNLL
jgi:hypothetical protein